MQKTLIYINTDTKSQIDVAGNPVRKTTDMPNIERGQWQVLCFQFMDVSTDDVGGVTLTPHVFDTGSSFVLVADNDFKDNNSLMFKSLSSVVPFDENDSTSNRMNIEGDWIDNTTADLTKGQISFRINTDTVKFAECLGSNLSYSSSTYINIKQYTSGLSNPSGVASVKFVAVNTIRDWNTPEEQPPEGTALVPFIDSYLKQPMEFQYSSNGKDWHTEQYSNDIYYRQRISGVNTEWSPAVKFVQHKTASSIEVSELIDGMISVPNTNPPVMLKTSKGTLFTVRDGIYITSDNSAFLIDPAPYLAEENTAEFTGTWTIWVASGTSTDGGNSAPSVTQEEFNAFKASTEQGLTELNGKVSGMDISETENATVPLVHNSVVKYSLTTYDAISVDVSSMISNKSATMELWLTMPETVVSFSIPNVTWIEEPSFDTGNMLYCVVLRWDGAKVLANLAYSVEVS